MNFALNVFPALSAFANPMQDFMRLLGFGTGTRRSHRAASPSTCPATQFAIKTISPHANRTGAKATIHSKSGGGTALRVVRVMEAGQSPAQVGRMVISGRMADVCAELDRLAARSEGCV